MTLHLLLLPIIVLAALGSYMFGRSKGYQQGYALGIKVADAWERTAEILQKKLDGNA